MLDTRLDSRSWVVRKSKGYWFCYCLGRLILSTLHSAALSRPPLFEATANFRAFKLASSGAKGSSHERDTFPPEARLLGPLAHSLGQSR